MSLDRLIFEVQRDLAEEGAAWALVGGVAVGARTEPRFTADLDIAVSVADDASAESLLRVLRSKGHRILALVEQTAVGRLATARLQFAGFAPMVDLLFASSGIENEVVDAAEVLEVFPGARVPVASVADLVVMKVLARDDSRRDQDRSDLRRLLEVAVPHDLERVRELLDLVQERGFSRGKDLHLELCRTLKEFGRA